MSYFEDNYYTVDPDDSNNTFDRDRDIVEDYWEQLRLNFGSAFVDECQKFERREELRPVEQQKVSQCDFCTKHHKSLSCDRIESIEYSKGAISKINFRRNFNQGSWISW